jgi:hypothetical protein
MSETETQSRAAHETLRDQVRYVGFKCHRRFRDRDVAVLFLIAELVPVW